ncbi:hypothetical protein PHSY_002461 [Pseudozyma hubeiensis SY62]|uniref:Uncharacterized protein n=1 Tax=Pseudozyma hubeiensis (strain SY62) TaxID=1305764 RepID=R9P0X5_PSEHS|nr:hypothetical protein PHSY_002461 [Pseudozyma hubeiensis SY62]GAC94888.1 hypothetical protein PHSY_002461 [Pseudozyma hubeiensis SY62]
MSHLSVLSAPLSKPTRRSEDDAYFTTQACSSSNSTLAIPNNFLKPSRSRSNSFLPKLGGVSSLPASPIASCFPQRPGFRRAATSAAVSTVSTCADSTRFDELHYSQTHFSRSTLLVYPGPESNTQIDGSRAEAEEDIRELLLASSDEESSAPPSTPGIDSSRIPPRGSSVLVSHPKQSMESEKSTLSLPEPITLLAAPTPQVHENRRAG